MMHSNRSGPGSGGPMAAMRKGDRAVNFKATMLRLGQYLAAYRLRLIVVAIFAVASTVFNIIGPKVLGNATTALFEGVLAQIAGTGEIDFSYIGRILLIMLVLYIAASIFSYLMGWIMAGVSTDIAYRFRQEIAAKINRLPLSYFDKTPQGEVLSRITNDVDTINQTLSQSLTQIITSTITVVGVLVMMLSISWLMTLVAMIVIPLSLGVVAVIVKRSQVYFKEQQDFLGHVNGHVEEMFGGHRVMKAFNGEARSIEQFEVYNNTLYGVAWKSQFLSGLMMPIMTFIGNLGYVGVVVMGGYLAIRNVITVGDIQAFIQYVRNFNMPLMQLANISNVLQQTAAAAERVFEFVGEAEEVVETAEPVEVTAMEGHVTFRNVRFSYEPDKPVIKNLSAEVQPGQKVAIVGPTGAGKTTIVKLLMRFYDVSDGAILVDDHDIRDFRRAGPAPLVRHGPAGHLALQRHDHGKHPLRTSRGHRRGSHRRRRGGPRRPLRQHPARRLQDGDQRGDDQHLPGTDAAADHCPGGAGRSAHPDPRRGHQLGGHAHRGADPAGNGPPDGRAHELHHRPPPLDHSQRRPDPGHARRRYRRAGHPRGAAGARTASTPSCTTASSNTPRTACRRLRS